VPSAVKTGSLHVQEKHIRPAVPVYIGKGCIAAPAVRPETDFSRDIFEFVVTQILVENRVFESFWIEMTEKRVFEPDVFSMSLFIPGVHAHVADQQVNQTVVIVI